MLEAFPIVPLDDIVDGQPVLALDELDLAPDWGVGTTTSPGGRIPMLLAESPTGLK